MGLAVTVSVTVEETFDPSFAVAVMLAVPCLIRFAVKRLAELRHGTKTSRLVGSLNANQVANHYRSWCKRMKLPCVPPRNLRHTFGTLAIKAGTDISVVARQLGHSDIQTTARYYLKPDLSVLKDMQKAWQKLILTC